MLPLNNISKLKLLEIIGRITFFKAFTINEREKLLNSTKVYKCIKDQNVQSELDHNSHFYIVLTGEVEITRQGGKQPLGKISAGQFIGEGSFIKKRPKSASAKAVSDSLVLCMDQDTLHGLPSTLKDKFKDAVIEGMAQRIHYLSDEIQQFHDKFSPK
ncbi:cyclic nucleotide-binding domain-containing protein [Thalassotalea sp. M1531]|uniref:Cyclic nucleotide-binding domain-containing protein n=1 Tax=Thalassotalea algicola TaxID=2716224 RepID=A0A7Y0Q648_9GAMM|nr:cyclic nucleotide-binding domain-containing protein [Thalassotalea algicola]NMP31624.1 cyclic nucleotide-binding domain-containing protein [Thalassotalea algicola]